MFCPAKDKSNPKHKSIDMAPQPPLREAERENYAFFLDLPEPDRTKPRVLDVKTTQFFQPLFEYSGACAGCGETPYLKLLTQLFGDRILIANATGCSSIYGGNLPTTPYTPTATAAAPPGPTPSSRTTRSSASACGWRSTATARRRASCSRVWCRDSPEISSTDLLTANQAGEAAIAAQTGEGRALEDSCSRAGPIPRRSA